MNDAKIGMVNYAVRHVASWDLRHPVVNEHEQGKKLAEEDNGFLGLGLVAGIRLDHSKDGNDGLELYLFRNYL